MNSLLAAHNNIRRWREDPVAFVVEVLGVQPDEWQVDVLRAFPNNRRLAMQACKGPGKTAILSWLAWNFLATRPHPKVIATSITGSNLRDGLWTEMAKWQARSPFLTEAFEWAAERIKSRDHHKTWYMAARTWARGADSSQQANTLAGLHAENILFILDEVGGIPNAVMAAAEAALSNDTGQGYQEAKILMAGNPTHLEGPLYRAATVERHLWHLTCITADPDDPKRTDRVSKQWAQEQIDKYGKDNPWVLVNVFGRFPPSSINTLLGPDEVADSMKRAIREEHFCFSQKRLGIDVARFGDDRTIIFPRQGLIAFKYVEMRGAKTQDIAARALAAKYKWGSELEFVDGTGGYGAGVVDAMGQAGEPPHEIHFSGKPLDTRYLNKRAEMWFLMSEWVKRGGLPNIPELARELTAPTYTFVNGKFQLESKDLIKARLGFSPDAADALALTFALPDMPSAQEKLMGFEEKGNHAKSEWDPFDPSRM